MERQDSQSQPQVEMEASPTPIAVNPVDTETNTKKKRIRVNYTKDEVAALNLSVAKYYNLLFGKHSQSVSDYMKHSIWKQVLGDVNSVSPCGRTLQQIKIKYTEMKKAKKVKLEKRGSSGPKDGAGGSGSMEQSQSQSQGSQEFSQDSVEPNQMIESVLSGNSVGVADSGFGDNKIGSLMDTDSSGSGTSGSSSGGSTIKGRKGRMTLSQPNLDSSVANRIGRPRKQLQNQIQNQFTPLHTDPFSASTFYFQHKQVELMTKQVAQLQRIADSFEERNRLEARMIEMERRKMVLVLGADV